MGNFFYGVKKMKFQIYTLGCKVNAYESEMMKEKMLKAGYIYDEKKQMCIRDRLKSILTVFTVLI